MAKKPLSLQLSDGERLQGVQEPGGPGSTQILIAKSDSMEPVAIMF